MNFVVKPELLNEIELKSPKFPDLGFPCEKKSFPGLTEFILKKCDRIIELPLSEINFQLFNSTITDIQSELGISDITNFDFIFDANYCISEKKIKFSSGYSESFCEMVGFFISSFYELKKLEKKGFTIDEDKTFVGDEFKEFTHDELEDYVDYISSKFFIIEKKKSKLYKLKNLVMKENKIVLIFDSFILINEDEKILSFFNNLVNSINNHYSFLLHSKDEHSKIIGQNINFGDELNINDLDSLLEDLNNFYEIIQKTNNDLKNYLYEVLKLLNLLICIQKYIKSTSYDFIRDKILNSNQKGIDSYNLGKELENSEEMLNLSSLLILMTHLYKKCDELNFNNFEKDFLIKFVGIDISTNLLSKLKKSKINKELENISSYDNRLLILKIILKGEKFFLNKGKESNDNILFKYIKGITNNEKLSCIYDFFCKNIIEYSLKELIFIFINNFETTFFVEDKISIVNIILWIENGINISDIKTLNKTDFIYLRGLSDISEVKKIISIISKNTEVCNLHASFINKKQILNKIFSFVHQSDKFYIQVKDLLNLKFTEIKDIPKYLDELESIFSENKINETSEKNERFLSGENNNIEALDCYYLLFFELEDRYLYNLLEKIFSLNIEDFQYIKNVLFKFQGDITGYKRILNGGYIKKILVNNNLINLFLEDDNKYKLSDILDEIDKEKTELPIFVNLFEKIEYEIKELYGDFDGEIIINLGFSDCIYKYIINIGKLLNGYKGDFVSWLENNTKLNKLNIENIFNLFSFFKMNEIYYFDNIGGILNKIILLEKDPEEITFLYLSFKDVGEIKDSKELLKVVIEYLKIKDKSIIEGYLIKLKKAELISYKKEDRFIKTIVEKGTIDEKEKLGKKLSILVNEIVELFDPRQFTSTLNKGAGKGAGGATKTFKRFFLKNLLIKPEEPFVDYLNRIYVINWKDTMETSNFDFSGVKRFVNVSYSSEDIDYLFFDAFEKFPNLMSTYEGLQSNNSFSELINAFNDLYKELVKDFKELNQIK